MHSLCVIISCAVIPLIASLVYLKIVLPPRSWAQNTSGGLLGEAYIRGERDARQYADRAVQEAQQIWDEASSNWENTYDSDALKVEVRRVTEGLYANSGILIGRSTGTVAGANPDEVYNYFISPEGMQLLDETMDPDQVKKYIERYGSPERGSYLDIHESFNPMPPGVTDRYHLVLNGYFLRKRFFFCKSIVHDSIPGSSPYFSFTNQTASDVARVDPRFRAVNTFYFDIQPTLDGTGSVVRMVNYFDFQFGSTLVNWLVAKGFFPGVYQRIGEKFGSATS